MHEEKHIIPKQLNYMKRGSQNYTLQRDAKCTTTKWKLGVFKTKKKGIIKPSRLFKQVVKTYSRIEFPLLGIGRVTNFGRGRSPVRTSSFLDERERERDERVTDGDSRGQC